VIGPLTDPAAGLAALAAGPFGADAAERLRGRGPEEAAREFEVLLLAQLIGAMRKTVSTMDSGLLSASPERRMLDGAFDQEIARSLAERADLGLAREIAARLRADEAAVAPEKALSPAAPDVAGGLREKAAKVYRGAAESISNERS
jgi:Rod binding domain-containing protein